MSNQKLAATIIIGAALNSSFKSSIGSAMSRISGVNSSIKSLTDQQKRLTQVSEHWKKMGLDASRYRVELGRVNAELKRQKLLQRNLQQQDANRSKRDDYRSQLFDTVAVGSSLVAPIATSMNFEQSMINVGAIARASEQDLGRLTDEARRLGATTNYSASEAADGMKFLSMAGFDTQKTIEAMPGVLDLASAGVVDIGSAADISSNVLSGFNMQASEMGRLGDVLVNTFTSSNTSLSSLGETMKYVAPIAASTNVSLEQTAAMAGKLGDAGIQGSEAGTALRSVISRLAAPTSAAAKQLEQLNIQTTDADGNLRQVPDILADLDKSMKGFGSAAKTQIVSTIFGMEAASAATVLLAQAGSGSLQQYAEKLKESGTAAALSKKMNDSATGAYKRMGSAIESIAITIGNVMLPAVSNIFEGIASVTGVVDSFAKQFPTLTTVVVGATSVLIGLKVATVAGGFAATFFKGGLLQTIGMFYRFAPAAVIASTSAGAVGTSMTAAAAGPTFLGRAFMWLGRIMLMNPIGIVITAIAAAAFLLFDSWDQVKEYFSAFWDRTVELFNMGWSFIKEAWSWTPIGLVMDNWGPISDFWDGLMGGIQETARAVFDWVAAKLEWVGDAIKRVKSFFGFGEDDVKAEEARKTSAQIRSEQRASQAISNVALKGPSQTKSITVNNADQITINTQLGQNPREIAAEIDRLKRERDRAALYDHGELYGY